MSLSLKIPKALIKLSLHQWAFPGGLLLMSVIIASTDVQSLSNQVNVEGLKTAETLHGQFCGPLRTAYSPLDSHGL